MYLYIKIHFIYTWWLDTEFSLKSTGTIQLWYTCKLTCEIGHLIKSMLISSSVWPLLWCIHRASPGPFDHIVPPPPDIQPVIDRMAMYVAKNGIEFEIVVKSKNDPRFQFLLPHHVHFPYYDFKKQIHMRVRCFFVFTWSLKWTKFLWKFYNASILWVFFWPGICHLFIGGSKRERKRDEGCWKANSKTELLHQT